VTDVALPPGTLPAQTREQSRLAERRRLSPYSDKVRDEQRFGKGVREQLRQMFYSGGNVGVGAPRTKSIAEAGDEAAAFYREHVSELDALYRAGFSAADAARRVGRAHGVRFFK